MMVEQRLINESRDLIDSIRVERSTVTEKKWLRDAPGMVDEGEIRRRAIEDHVDGCARVTLSDDEMIGYISLYPPQGFGQPLKTSDVYARLCESGVSHGVRSKLVETALFTCNTERTPLHSVEVAFGTTPIHSKPKHLRIVEHNKESVETSDKEAVDHRVRSSLSLAEAGETLAVVEPEVVGRDGITITGRILEHRTRTIPQLKTGDNVTLVDNKIVAEISGLLHLKESVISVSPTLPLSKGVGYHTGNIDFQGDVIISDRIADGFTVSCTGTLASSVTIDSFGISCNTLTSSQGLIGHVDAAVDVAADASLRFIQNASINVGGTLRVAHSALKSRIKAHNYVELAHGSSVVGSTIRAGLGAEVFNVGSPGAAASEIYLGIDFGVDERLATIRDHTLALSEKLRDVRLALSREEQTPQLVGLEHDLQAAIATLAEEAGELVSHLDRNEEASLVVHGT
ncbi:MAG: FapA family protein, partial [Spirochaetaceae bacterium]|nr:FapA family protein [Spirochaetaceae bacterium]